MEAVECGAASLAMILASYGRWIPLEQMRVDCGVSRDGSNLFNILKAARRHGMVAKGMKMTVEMLAQIGSPCILHWNMDHFIVLKRVKGKGDNLRYYVNDPARGSVKLTHDEVSRSFTGIALIMEPSADFRREGHQPSILSFVNKRLKHAREMMLFTFVTGLLLAVASVSLPIFSQLFADVILPGRNPDWVSPFFITYAAVIAYQMVIQLLQGTYAVRLRHQLSIDAYSQFLWHVLRLPMRFYSQRYAGDIIMRLRSAETIPETLVGQLAPLLTNILLLVIYLVFMLVYSLPLTAVAIGATVLNMIIARFVTRKQVNMSRLNERNANKLAGVTMNSLSSIETIKAAGAEEGFFKRWAGLYAVKTNNQFEIETVNMWLGILPALVTTIANNVILVLGTYYILEGQLTIGMLMAFQGFMGSYMSPVTTLIGSMQEFFGMRVQMERLEDVYKAEPDTISPLEDTRPLGTGKLNGEVELRSVTFGYNVLSDPLISDFSLCLKPGQSVAFVGASGCGKSTIAKLVSGLYQPWSGEILFDGKPMKDINRNTFVNSVSVVDQDVVMFEGTVADNIKMWDESIEDFSMILAANDAQIHKDIASRPGAYQTHMEGQGRNFSGGQRQRLEIAAALAKEPTVLILDEATSALDTNTEEMVMQAIKRLGVTLIIIAHRLSTIRDCDEIIVLDKGRVQERGDHDSLMQSQGYYYQLMQNA